MSAAMAEVTERDPVTGAAGAVGGAGGGGSVAAAGGTRVSTVGTKGASFVFALGIAGADSEGFVAFAAVTVPVASVLAELTGEALGSTESGVEVRKK